MGWFLRLADAAAYESGRIRRSAYLIGLLTWIPLLCYALVAAVFYAGVPRELPVGLVDLDRSALSHRVAFQLDAGSTLKIAGRYDSVAAAASDLRRSRIYAIVVIPAHFETDVYAAKKPSVTAMVNTQYILIGKIVSAALSETVGHSSAEVEVVRTLAAAARLEAALPAVSPVAVQMTPFFNEYNNYFIFLVSALLPALWQVFVVITLIAAFGREWKEGTVPQWLAAAGGSLSAALLGKTLPYTGAFFVQGVLILLFLYVALPWPFAGSWTVMLAALLLTTLVYVSIAMALFAWKFEYATALSLAAVYTAPAFAYLGITFPEYNMGSFASMWHGFLPLSHYMKVQISMANYGASPSEVAGEFGALALFLLILPPLWWRYRSGIGKTA